MPSTFYTLYEFYGDEAHEFRFETLEEIFREWDEQKYWPLIEKVTYAGGLDIQERFLTRKEIIAAHDQWESDRSVERRYGSDYACALWGF